MNQEKLNAIIREQLSNIIDSDYCLLDVPYYSNIGDSLIWFATEHFLNSLPYKCLYRASIRTFMYRDLPQSCIILLQGGGNFGDLYRHHNEFRKKVVELYPNNRIVILPQTVYYEGPLNAYRDAKEFRKHKSLTICARDYYSYRFLRLWSFSKDVLLIPDMVFCMDPLLLKPFLKPNNSKVLLFSRADKEMTDLGTAIVMDSTNEIETDLGDWPFYLGGDPFANELEAIINEGRLQDADRFAFENYLPQRVKTGVEFISQYSSVISNRLHGAILALLLGKPVALVDNSYGKNRHFYETWLKDYEGISLIKTAKSLNIKRLIKLVISWTLAHIL